MVHPAGLITADELERMPDDNYRYELVRGRLIRMSPVAPRHGQVTVTLLVVLAQHVKAHRLGQVWTEVGFRLFNNPDTVLAPDVAFVRAVQLPEPDAKGFYRGAPDLAIEVLSPDDRPGDVRGKIDDYLAAGARMVIVVDPAKRVVTVHAQDGPVVTLGEGDRLDLDEVVSGFSLPVSAIFE